MHWQTYYRLLPGYGGASIALDSDYLLDAIPGLLRC
jgi:hypothetical protein